MPKQKKRKRSNWTKSLDAQEVDEAFEDATVDAYGEDERHSGLLTMIQDEVQFSFGAKVLGELVDVVGMEWPEDDAFGLDFVCERNGK